MRQHLKYFDKTKYCSIEYYTGEYKKKYIQLEGNPEEMKQFSEQLKVILNYNKGTSMNELA